ncbi:MAG: riboflavin synthase [SAR202 cluster bacterium]|nr:riboflavin synthase [SAR202 cluster bacterium]
MFTGIVEEVGKVKETGKGKLAIAASLVLADAKLGGSISVNGACLTMTRLEGDSFSVDVVPETLRRTNLGALKAGSPVNLERPLAASGRLDGHIVQGHVDGTARITEMTPDGEATMVKFETPRPLMRYIVEKGFVAVDGASLTVVHSFEDSFTVTIIPFTKHNTVFGHRRVGDAVNIEVDILAKYLERLAKPVAPGGQ